MSEMEVPGSLSKPGLLRNAPLALSYIAYPVSSLISELLDVVLYRNWIDFAWLALTGLLILSRSHSREIGLTTKTPLFIVAGCMLATVLATISVTAGQAPLVTTAMELKPVLYILIVVLMLSRVSAPDPEGFCRYGKWLAWILIAELLFKSAIYSVFWQPTVVRPYGSGEINYDAALLSFSLLFSLSARHLARRYAWIILLGIIASFSRTNLLVAVLVLLFSSVIPLRIRLLMCLLAALAIFGAFAVRGMETGSLESMDRLWMWAVGTDYLFSSPQATAFNFVPGHAVEVDVPVFLEWLWSKQQENLGVEGIYPFHFHAMWLRLAISWGWFPVIAAIVFFFSRYVTSRRRALMSRSYFLIVFMLGLTMGVFYLSNVAPIALLAGYILRPKRVRAMKPGRLSAMRRNTVLPAIQRVQKPHSA